MSKYILMVLIFLLTGCRGPGDRMIPREFITAVIKKIRFV